MYKVVEMQVSLIHDLFYTKVEVMYTWYGFCIRILELLATAVAFLLFNMLLLSNDYRKLMNDGYSKVDVVVTNVLFVGAIILDCVSLFRAMYSTWTCALLIEWRRDRYGEPDEITRLRGLGLAVCTFLASMLVYLRRTVHAAEWRRRCSWSRSMGAAKPDSAVHAQQVQPKQQDGEMDGSGGPVEHECLLLVRFRLGARQAAASEEHPSAGG